jgi:transposase
MKPKQSIPKQMRFTINDFRAQFPDDDTCLDFLKDQKYPSGLVPCKKSSTSLCTWLYAMYLMSATRCGISAKQIQRETGVTYKTAWRMFKQIRTLMSEDVSLEGEAVEMDETYVGGKRRIGAKRGRPAQPTMARRRA